MNFCKYCDAAINRRRVCPECVGILRNTILVTNTERARFIAKRLKVNYRSLLGMPHWDADYLEDLSPNLRQYVLAQIAAKAEVIRRIDYARTLANAVPF